MPKPDCEQVLDMHCPDPIYEKMCECWRNEPEERPSFESLHRFFEDYYTETEPLYRKQTEPLYRKEAVALLKKHSLPTNSLNNLNQVQMAIHSTHIQAIQAGQKAVQSNRTTPTQQIQPTPFNVNTSSSGSGMVSLSGGSSTQHTPSNSHSNLVQASTVGGTGIGGTVAPMVGIGGTMAPMVGIGGAMAPMVGIGGTVAMVGSASMSPNKGSATPMQANSHSKVHLHNSHSNVQVVRLIGCSVPLAVGQGGGVVAVAGVNMGQQGAGLARDGCARASPSNYMGTSSPNEQALIPMPVKPI